MGDLLRDAINDVIDGLNQNGEPERHRRWRAPRN